MSGVSLFHRFKQQNTARPGTDERQVRAGFLHECLCRNFRFHPCERLPVRTCGRIGAVLDIKIEWRHNKLLPRRVKCTSDENGNQAAYKPGHPGGH